MFGPGDPPATVFAGDQPSFPVDSVAVRVHRRLAVYAQVRVILQHAHDAVVGNITEQHVAPGREVDWTFGPAEPGCDALYRHGAGEGWEAGRPERNLGLLERFQMRVRIAPPGQRPQGQRLGWIECRARLAERRYGLRVGRGRGRCSSNRCRQESASVHTFLPRRVVPNPLVVPAVSAECSDRLLCTARLARQLNHKDAVPSTSIWPASLFARLLRPARFTR